VVAIDREVGRDPGARAAPTAVEAVTASSDKPERETIGWVRVPGGDWVMVEVPPDADESERKQAALDALARAQEQLDIDVDQR